MGGQRERKCSRRAEKSTPEEEKGKGEEERLAMTDVQARVIMNLLDQVEKLKAENLCLKSKENNLFEACIARGGPILLDGGLATELESQGFDINSELWSASLIKSDPEAIISAHVAYLEAGSGCIISASYQASREGFMSNLGLGAEEADALITEAVTLAKTARSRFVQEQKQKHKQNATSPIVAASVGPFGATLHDGSEYTGAYKVGADFLRQFHRGRLKLLDCSGADVLACETIPSFLEAQVLCDLLLAVQTPAWVSFSCPDALSISDGTPMKKVAALFATHPRVLAIGVNCTPPQHVESLIAEIHKAAPNKAVIVYPNSGETYVSADNSWHGTVLAEECADAAVKWSNAGACFVGGCCRMGPGHIKAMGEALVKSTIRQHLLAKKQ